MKLFKLLVLVSFFAWVGCASGGSSDAPAADDGVDFSAPAGSGFSNVRVGMNDADVLNALGEPDDANAYMTGKSWIPFYYGPDTYRTDWMYKGQGRVVFTRNRYSGGLKVIEVLYNPNELQ